MHAGEWAQLMVLMVLPTLLVALALHAGQIVRAVQRVSTRRPIDSELQPTRPPIERLASDLRRLLDRHELIKRSVDLPMRAQRLRAVEGAIADCAIEAACALGLHDQVGGTRRSLSTPQLRRLLQCLANEGLALPTSISLLANSPE